MTTLIAWTSHDQERFAALHVASDSRISWGSSIHRWDAGRKIFATRSTPDIWAYSGDVLFPALVLSQLMSASDAGLLFDEHSTAQDRHDITMDALRSSFQRRHNAPDRTFTIMHASRDGEKAGARPRLWQTSFDHRTSRWKDEETEIDDQPHLVAVHGSGSTSLKKEARRWEQSNIGGTSRSIYSAFHAAISSGADPLSGGAPQLASIYPQGSAVTAGAVHDGRLYLHGLPINAMADSGRIEWFDALFQRIDPQTLKVRAGAARHAKPKLS